MITQNLAQSMVFSLAVVHMDWPGLHIPWEDTDHNAPKITSPWNPVSLLYCMLQTWHVQGLWTRPSPISMYKHFSNYLYSSDNLTVMRSTRWIISIPSKTHLWHLLFFCQCPKRDNCMLLTKPSGPHFPFGGWGSGLLYFSHNSESAAVATNAPPTMTMGPVARLHLVEITIAAYDGPKCARLASYLPMI